MGPHPVSYKALGQRMAAPSWVSPMLETSSLSLTVSQVLWGGKQQCSLSFLSEDSEMGCIQSLQG